jgi:hypothetical protein
MNRDEFHDYINENYDKRDTLFCPFCGSNTHWVKLFRTRYDVNGELEYEYVMECKEAGYRRDINITVRMQYTTMLPISLAEKDRFYKLV